MNPKLDIGERKEEKEKPEQIKLPVRFENGFFWDADDKIFAQIRGWGWLKHIKGEDAQEVQDRIGLWMAEKINEGDYE